MAGYVDGFVLPVPKNKLNEYKKMCALMGKVMRKYGALDYYECVGDDMSSKWGTVPFPKMAGAKKSEVVVFSFCLYRNKAHRDLVHEKMMKDPLMNDPKMKDKPMPFDMKRMASGGFKTFYKM